jgi:hypothetical protein
MMSWTQQKVFEHKAFGLTIRSEIPLTAMPATIAGEPDLVVRYGKLFGSDRPSIPMQLLKCSPEMVCLYWPKVGAFASHRGRDIVIDADPGVSEATLADWVQSSAFAIALHQRGLFILHASAVVIDGIGVPCGRAPDADRRSGRDRYHHSPANGSARISAR